MMDFENSILEHNWGNRKPPKGNKRHEDEEWVAIIKSQVYPYHSDVDWEIYVMWVEQGGGDEWFQNESLIN